MSGWKDNIHFVLVEPLEPGNIGASARAVKNMGFKNLCLVNPPVEFRTDARKFARNALDILEPAKVYDSLADAVGDKTFIAGTTRRKGLRRGIMLPAAAGAIEIANMATRNKVAILFGRESKGLYNNEIDECAFMLNIPSSEEQPSLNLSQAVLIIAYELSKCAADAHDHAVKKKRFDNTALPEELLPHEKVSPLYEKIAGILEIMEYAPKGERELLKKTVTNLKRFIGRSGLTEKELNMLLGFCAKVEKLAAKNHARQN
ncbi:MAG: RNA methyltransferase [Nitrospirae bacterium]|nr:RNA methyltransferase [Nitrospirota bacterium]